MNLAEFNFRNRRTIKLVKQALVAVALLFLIFRPNTYKTITGKGETKTIETRVEGKETEIKTYLTRVEKDQTVVNAISRTLEELQLQLDSVRGVKDTVKIIHIQDTVIHGYRELTSNLKNMVINQDSIISAQRYIINSKDTIITINKKDLKRVKRQRNTAILVAGATSIFFFIK